MGNENLKGVILAGGEGTRLRPLTLVTNKHLLPVFNKPMVQHPLETLKSVGVNDMCVVTGGDYIADFMRFLGSGVNFGVSVTYKIQDGPKGIAHALLQAQDFFGEHKVVAILGDNIFERLDAPAGSLTDDNAYIFLKKVPDAYRFGVAEVAGDGKVLGIEEKPKSPKSDYAVTGFYIYPNDVFDFVKGLKPSQRGELEITDVNNHYLKQGRLRAVYLDGFWSDAGTIETLLRASILEAKKGGIATGV